MKKNILLFLLLIAFAAKSQRTVQHYGLLWVNYQNNIELNKKWSLMNDVQFRTKDFVGQFVLFAVRSGASYILNEKYSVGAGVTWFGSMQYAPSGNFVRNEWRPWQDVSLLVKHNQLDITQRLRLEERFLQMLMGSKKTTQYETVMRLRYKIDLQKYLKNKKWSLKAGNEVMVNPAYLNSSRFFDQNRTFIGVGFQKNKVLQLQLQYMKIFQWRSSSEILEDQNVVRINFYHQLSLKSKHG